MAPSYASIGGKAATEATREGSYSAPAYGHVRGWHVGASVRMDRAGEEATVYATSGSRDTVPSQPLGTLRNVDGTLQLEPSAWLLGQVDAWRKLERKRQRQEAKAAAKAAKLARYRQLRQDGHRAASAWQLAGQAPAPQLDWQEDGRGHRVATVQEGGYSVRVLVEDDLCYVEEPGRWLQSWQPGAVSVPEPERERGHYHHWLPDITYAEHVRGLRQIGYGRHEADCLARSYVRRDFQRARHPESYAVVAVYAYASRAGVELGSASIGGCELGTGYVEDSTLSELVAEHDLVAEAVREAVAAAARLLEVTA